MYVFESVREGFVCTCVPVCPCERMGGFIPREEFDVEDIAAEPCEDAQPRLFITVGVGLWVGVGKRAGGRGRYLVFSRS